MLRSLLYLPALLALTFLSGCGAPTGEVTGTVTYKGKPVVVGSVVLVDEATMAFTQEPIQPDGSYHFAHAPQGVLKVAVHSPNPGHQPEVSRAIPEGLTKTPKETAVQPRPGADSWFAIPEKYSDWRRSGLAVTVAGSTRFDIPLAD